MSNINLCKCEEYWMEIKNKNGSLYKLSSKGRMYSYHSKRMYFLQIILMMMYML